MCMCGGERGEGGYGGGGRRLQLSGSLAYVSILTESMTANKHEKRQNVDVRYLPYV